MALFRVYQIDSHAAVSADHVAKVPTEKYRNAGDNRRGYVLSVIKPCRTKDSRRQVGVGQRVHFRGPREHGKRLHKLKHLGAARVRHVLDFFENDATDGRVKGRELPPGPGQIPWDLIARVYPSYPLPGIDERAWESAAWDELCDLLRKNKTKIGNPRLRADLTGSGPLAHPTGPLKQHRDTFLDQHRRIRTNRARAAELDFLIDRIGQNSWVCSCRINSRASKYALTTDVSR